MSNAPTPERRDPALARLESRLGYQFRQPELLELALTHKSFAKDNNERLEFIGDAVLGYIIGSMLYHHESSWREDALSLVRADLVRRSTLAGISRALDLMAHLRLGSGERKSGGRGRDSILADAFEAVVGAVHEDGGISACEGVISRLFKDRIAGVDPEALKDPKTKLQEHLQGRQIDLPNYEVVGTAGAEHARQYTVACEVAVLGIREEATASSRRAAEKAAALRVLSALPDSPGAV